MKHIKALLFDKDGTLFDFQATWGAWAESMIAELADADEALQSAMADALEFDRSTHLFLPSSPVIAGTGSEVSALIAPLLSGTDIAQLEARIADAASRAPLVSPVPLRPLLSRLRRAGYRLGVATNDYESVARDHIRTVGDLFDFVAGFDSGFGGKPEPGMLLAFANACAMPPTWWPTQMKFCPISGTCRICWALLEAVRLSLRSLFQAEAKREEWRRCMVW